MENKLSYEKLFEIAWNAIQEMEYSEYEHGAILDYLNITEEQYQFIKESVNGKGKIWKEYYQVIRCLLKTPTSLFGWQRKN